MKMVFQDPYASLNPRKRVGYIVGEPLEVHGIGDAGRAASARVQELLEVVGLNPEHYNRFPHEFSGGQRQRIGIARALARQPEADRLRRAGLGARRLGAGADPEPAQGPAEGVRADVRLHRARPERRPAHLRPRVVMYLGKIVELATGDELYANPKHPYTGALLSAVPIPDPEQRPRAEARHARGRRSEPDQPAVRLPLPSALPALPRGALRRRHPALDAISPRHQVACHYPLERWPMDMRMDAPVAPDAAVATTAE